MRLKRKTLLEKIDMRLASDKKAFAITKEVALKKYDLNKADWLVLHGPAWDKFIIEAKKRRAHGDTIPLSLIPQERNAERRYGDSKIAAIDDYEEDIYEPDAKLMLLRDILTSSDDDVIETKDLGFKTILADLNIR